LRAVASLLSIAGFLVIAVCLIAARSAAATEQQKQEDERSPAPTHYIRTLGPFPVDGQHFGVKLNVTCYKDSPHPGMCNEDDQEAVRSVKIVDDAGKTRFSKSFPIGFMHQLERHVVNATLLEGSEHQALELTYEQLPSHANTGVTIQLFGLRHGTLQPLNPEPLEFYGQLGELPPGQSKNSKHLLADNMLPIYVLTSYFYVVSQVRVNWKDFRLDQRESGEFDVVHQQPYERKPDIQAVGFIHLYPSPDANSTSAGVDINPQSNVQILKALFRKGPPDEHDAPSDTWLKVSINGKVGWIVGLDDYTAIGLSPAR
jgi:hypothetical protein